MGLTNIHSANGKLHKPKHIPAFSIVELLIVIVVIGILATITFVSFGGITSKANVASIQSDLDSNSRKLQLYNTQYGYYPSSLDANNCPLAPNVDSNYCLKSSNGTTLSYVTATTTNATSYSLVATNGSNKYQTTSSTTPDVVPSVVTSGLNLHLDAGNSSSYPGSGNTWYDISGNSNNGTLTNGANYNSSYGGAINFDGIDDYVNGTNVASTSITGDVTVDIWVRISSPQLDWVRVFGKGDNINRTYGMWYYPMNSFLYQRYGTVPAGSTISTTISSNIWYNLVGVSSGTNHYLYVNNNLVATSTAGSSFYASTDPYKVGYAGFHTYHSGTISAVKLYNRALSTNELNQNFNALRGRYGF